MTSLLSKLKGLLRATLPSWGIVRTYKNHRIADMHILHITKNSLRFHNLYLLVGHRVNSFIYDFIDEVIYVQNKVGKYIENGLCF